MPAAPPFEHTPYDHHIGSFGPEGLGWQRSVDPAALSTDQLVATRAYSRNLETDTVDEIVEGCTLSLRRYGFCVIDHAIPREQVPAVRHELSVGTEEKLAALSPDEQRRDGLNGSSRPINQLVLQPLFAQYVCQPAVVGVAKTMLDSHVRITATGTRNFLDGFGPAGLRGEATGREYHTDWPHDLGQGANGAMRQPFADVCMCLSMVWYMQDTGPDSGELHQRHRGLFHSTLAVIHTLAAVHRWGLFGMQHQEGRTWSLVRIVIYGTRAALQTASP